METKYNICDKVVYFNTAEERIASAEIKGIRVIPTGVSQDEEGKRKLDGSVVLYETFDGPVLAEKECFSTEAECREWYLKFFQKK